VSFIDTKIGRRQIQKDTLTGPILLNRDSIVSLFTSSKRKFSVSVVSILTGDSAPFLIFIIVDFNIGKHNLAVQTRPVSCHTDLVFRIQHGPAPCFLAAIAEPMCRCLRRSRQKPATIRETKAATNHAPGPSHFTTSNAYHFELLARSSLRGRFIFRNPKSRPENDPSVCLSRQYRLFSI
jgi:hypothetical protein